MEATHNLPFDIIRLIFEFSAFESLESGRTLSLVSKEVQRWTDPHLFRIVQGHGFVSSYTTNRGLSLLDRMCAHDASPRIVHARQYVRVVAWKERVIFQFDLERALDTFPNATQLCLWENIFPNTSSRRRFEITKSHPSLRRVTTNLYNRSSCTIAPCLHSIRHSNFPSSPP
ncbi:hypothetical protein DL96DRAFT_1679424 [Flagelloscypha sp. PMI_526]|nr:hypothetical protein DL96DRAFT_1679424 [Flagelloscypha sp. PMI_526]